MRKLLQRHASDCFPTCLAMILGISHKEALKICHPKHKKWKDYSVSLYKANKILTKSVLKTKINHFFMEDKVLDKIENDAILICRFNSGVHAVVWDSKKKKVLDPTSKVPLPNKAYAKRTMMFWEIEGVK